MNINIDNLVRDNIKRMKPYSSARDEFKGEATIFLDANENAFGSPLPVNYNRYPDPQQLKLKQAISGIKSVCTENIFIGNGSDEIIDLLYRIFCIPAIDNVIVCPPTYGMYEVCGNINDVLIKKVSLRADFQLNVAGILKEMDANTKLLFICSPNNPTGNSMKRSDIEMLLNNFNGIVIIDEAYIDFSNQTSFIHETTKHNNLVIIQTLSKAWGLASLRIGICFASQSIIDLLNKVKPPYNINQCSQDLGLAALTQIDKVNAWIKSIVTEREILKTALTGLTYVESMYESDANFLLVKVKDAERLYQYLSVNKIIVRNRSKEINCAGCLRITVGTSQENQELINLMKLFN